MTAAAVESMVVGRRSAAALPATRFELSSRNLAAQPPERRGLARDGVRLLVARPGGVEHRRFRDLADLLAPGDLLVLNTSATLPAALDGVLPGGRVRPVHVSAPLPDGTWAVEIRRPDATGPVHDLRRGAVVRLPAQVRLRLVEPYPDAAVQGSRLWRAAVWPAVDPVEYLARHGRPISYKYVAGRFPIDDYQTVYATQPGSAEMPSAGRPFTTELLVRLVAHGVTVAPIVLHAGVSSQEAGEPPLPERFEVPEDTARLVRSARAAGRRVVAVGTTVVRALESAVRPDGGVGAAQGWTEVVIGPGHPVRVVTGMITGLHPPEASHLLLLEAVAGPALVAAAYREAVTRSYLWHEFGDSMLLLP